jgi:hypothetical protein
VTTLSNPWGDGWGPRLGRRRARRMSRRFAHVGVGINAARLRDMAAGGPVSDDELTDVNFALAATEIEREARRAKLAACRRCGTRWLLFAAVVIMMLNVLVCAAYLMVSLASPF